MPELPEVELALRRILPGILGREIRDVTLCNSRVIRPLPAGSFLSAVRDRRIEGIRRRGKYLVFQLGPRPAAPDLLLLHLGMSGRLEVVSPQGSRTRHAAALFDLGDVGLAFEDVRQLGRIQLGGDALGSLGPEPLEKSFGPASLVRIAGNSRRGIKVCLMDQGCIAGLGNIYAAESLFRSRIHPAREARALNRREWERLWRSIREVLTEAIERGVDESGRPGPRFYHRAPGVSADAGPTPVFQVYDREGRPCPACGEPVRRILQSGRSTYFCPGCQQ
ncbi:MAG: bifunctional DNA-formamidopyrimidine glycosylase/DNA-(apurinic or apyrimidinic site) lyase [Verrucomicrobiales bacterium]|nr:bifunctional DNA-formamidopyrimidine glycosylase/DNA-(apurinic or apyrimidinic site) lyase [Verrucomicrobiales bacterium]